jgi:hypothetical protein
VRPLEVNRVATTSPSASWMSIESRKSWKARRNSVAKAFIASVPRSISDEPNALTAPMPRRNLTDDSVNKRIT